MVNLDPRVPHKALPQVVQKKVKLTVIGALSDTKVIPPVPVFSKPILGFMIEQPATLNARASDVAIPAEEECIKEYDATMTTDVKLEDVKLEEDKNTEADFCTDEASDMTDSWEQGPQ